jgi:PAS domain S-box-containing protein
MSNIMQTGRLMPASYKTLATILETLPGALFVVDDAATIIYANINAQAITGATQEELLGKSLWRGAPQLVSTTLYQAMHKTKQSREPIEVEYLSPMTRMWLHVQLTPTLEGVLLHFHEKRESTRSWETFSPEHHLAADILENMYISAGFLTPEGILLEINEASLADAQILREEVIGLPFAETIWWTPYPASQQQLRAAIARAGRGETVRFETTVHPRKGMDLHLEVTITPHRDADHNVEYLVYVGADVTARKQAEDKIRDLIDAIPQMVWIAGPDGFATYQNQRVIEALSMTHEQAEGNGWLAAIHPDDRQRMWEAWQRSLQTGENFEMEHRVRDSSSGVYRWHLVRSVPRRNVQGEILDWVGTCTDIDKQKQVEQQLKESREGLRMLAETLPQLVWTTYPDGQHEYTNQRWKDYTGFIDEQIQRDRWAYLQFIHPDDQERHQARWLYALNTGELFEDEVRIKNSQTGEYRWFLTRAVPVRDEAGRIVKWFGTSTDIDEQKRMEEALRQLEQRKDDFINMASHELRTPLTTLKMQTQLVRKRLEKQAQHEAVAALSRVEGPIKQLERLIGELLDISKIQVGRLEYLWEPVNLNLLLREIAETMRQTHPGYTILVRGTAPASLVGDRDRLGQVFTNLLHNAIKYSLNTTTIEIDLSASDEAVTVRVQDHGLGIPHELHSKIFERCYRAFNSSQRTISGLGMGLYIVNEIVKGHGGSITVDSEIGKGSTFTVTIPRRRDS